MRRRRSWKRRSKWSGSKPGNAFKPALQRSESRLEREERLDDLGYPHAHSETEKGASPQVVRFQIRPNPLAH